MKQFIIQFARLLQPQRRLIGLTLLLIVVLEAIFIVPTYFLKLFLDELTTGTTLHIIALLGAGMYAVSQFAAWLDALADRKILSILYWLESYLPQQVQQKLLSLSPGYHEDEQTGKQIVRLERGTVKVIEFGAQLLWSLIPLLFQIVWTIGIMVTLDWQITVLFTIAIPLFVLLTWYLQEKTYPWRVEQEDLHERSSAQLCESIVNIKTVQAFAQEHREAKQYRSMRERIEALGEQRWILATQMNFWRMLVINTTRFAIWILAGWKVSTGALSIGSIVLFLTLSEKVYISMFNLNQTLDRMVEATEPIGRIFNILNTAPRVPIRADAITPESWIGRIELQNVSFGYTPEQTVLEGISFTIEPGETVALAGPSGGGKSTLIKLLFRYYDPTSGKIVVDGHDLRDLNPQAYRANTGYVPQEVEIMSGTVWDNIRYGKPDATDEEIKQAATLARVDDFVSNFRDGYNTIVGERGMKLSGGQRQRVGIARALLTDPSILVFDEATSNLDAESERAIQDALKTVEGQKTLILIAHRLSTIMHADKIMIIDDGRVAEMGTHAQLMKRNGLYEKLVRLQTEGDL